MKKSKKAKVAEVAKVVEPRIVNTIDEFLVEMGAETLFMAGRSLYKGVDCGPWTSFPMDTELLYNSKGVENGVEWEKSTMVDSIYYEDRLAKDTPRDFLDHIKGVKVGSIVEGSDVEIDGFELEFPFDMNKFWEKVEEVDKEASFYWDRDNNQFLKATKGQKEFFFKISCFGEIGWETVPKTSKKLRETIESHQEELVNIEDGSELELDGWKFENVDMGMLTF
jgi:hypothetical protein